MRRVFSRTHWHAGVPEVERAKITRIHAASVGEHAEQRALHQLAPRPGTAGMQPGRCALAQRETALIHRHCIKT